MSAKIFLYIALALLVFACGRAAPQANREGNEAFVSQRYDAALQAYERAQAEAPELAEPYYNSGNAYYRQRLLSEAQEQYRQALPYTDEKLAR